MEFSQVKENIQWNFPLEKEFRYPRKRGYTFVIDVLDGIVQLALYYIRPHFSYSTTLENKNQPPKEILTKALYEQGYYTAQDGLYPVNYETRKWIEKNLLNT